jgi:hypothetical protein
MHYTNATITVMRPIYLLLVSIVCFSCGNERILQLPEIQNADVTEIRDVSHAYLFYDETKEDSIELNRKNLIITTNWLINVDKRLTLGQVIPKIKFLQEKKRNAELHKNEDAKNYFTCNDTSIKNLGFLEFTDVNYIIEIDSYKNDSPLKQDVKYVTISFFDGYITISEIFNLKEIRNETFKESFLKNELIKLQKDSKQTRIDLMFMSRLTFQDYILIKSDLSKLESETISINNNEFIY